jgi:hypothetical protein
MGKLAHQCYLGSQLILHTWYPLFSQLKIMIATYIMSSNPSFPVLRPSTRSPTYQIRSIWAQSRTPSKTPRGTKTSILQDISPHHQDLGKTWRPSSNSSSYLLPRTSDLARTFFCISTEMWKKAAKSCVSLGKAVTKVGLNRLSITLVGATFNWKSKSSPSY